MPGRKKEINHKKREVQVLLASGYSKAETSQKTGVSTRSIYRWQHEDPDFVLEVEQAKKELYQQGIAVLCDGAREAAFVLRGIILDPDTSKAIKVRAIDTLLKYCQGNQKSDSDLMRALQLIVNAGILPTEIQFALNSKLDTLAGTCRDAFDLKPPENLPTKANAIQLIKAAIIGTSD